MLVRAVGVGEPCVLSLVVAALGLGAPHLSLPVSLRLRRRTPALRSWNKSGCPQRWASHKRYKNGSCGMNVGDRRD